MVELKQKMGRVIKQNLMQEVSKYRKKDPRKAIWQLINTIIPYSGLWILMIFIIKSSSSYLFTLPVSILAGLFLVRLFIFFHDCCHGSFFASSRANKIIGYFTGILTFTPFYHWRHSHNQFYLLWVLYTLFSLNNDSLLRKTGNVNTGASFLLILR
jgi:fatty acid desaturase